MNFRLLGVPVRISPFFWVVTAMLGWGDGDMQRVAIWVGCVFLSIMVHEMGHALTNRLFGRSPAIVLHGMGGLCFSEGPNISAWQRILVLFNGPFAGFLLYGVLSLVMTKVTIEDPNYLEVVSNLLFINLIWGLMNLVPIWPLDGGQITGVILMKLSPRRGQEFTHGLSLLIAGVIAILLYQKTNEIYLLLLMGIFAMNNFQMLQLLHHRHRLEADDDEQWWRK